MNKEKKTVGDKILKGIGVRRSNFIIYICCLMAGIVLIISAILSYDYIKETFVDELLFGLGCSTIPTVVAAFLIDRASEKRNEYKIESFRLHFLGCIPFGFLSVMKTVIKSFSSGDFEKPFYDAFKESIVAMKGEIYLDKDAERVALRIEQLKKDLKYGAFLCKKETKDILADVYELEINNIFSNDELLALEFLAENLDGLMESDDLYEMAELLEELVDDMIKSFPKEIGSKTNRTVVVKKGIIRNWLEITKK